MCAASSTSGWGWDMEWVKGRREGGREGEREGGREGESEGGREGGRGRGREGEKRKGVKKLVFQLECSTEEDACTCTMYMKTPIWSTLHHPNGTTQKGTTRG